LSVRWDLLLLAVAILPVVAAYFGLPEVSLCLPPVALVALIGYRLHRRQQRKRDPATDVRYLLQTRVLVSVEDKLDATEQAPRKLTGRIVFVYEVRRIRRLSGVVVQLDSAFWMGKVSWQFILLRPIIRDAGFEDLARHAQMEVSVSLATQSHLNRMRGKITGVRAARANPMLLLGRSRVFLLGLGR